MIRYSSTVTIDRSPREVFAALVDIERYERWTPMVDARWETPGPLRVGTQGSFRLAEGPIKGTLAAEVVELAPDRRVAFRIEHPALRWTSVSVVEPADAGTRLVYSGEIGLSGWRRLLEPFMAGEVRRGEHREAERLKALLEDAEEARPAPATA